MPADTPGDDDTDENTRDDPATTDQSTATPPRTTSERILEAVADATDTEPLELPPLHDTVDPDAVDDLFPADSAGNCRAAFEYASVRISIDPNGRIGVQPAAPADD